MNKNNIAINSACNARNTFTEVASAMSRDKRVWLSQTCDASWFPETSSARIAVDARDEQGKLIGAAVKSLKCDSLVVVAEGLATLEAIYLAKANRWRSIILENAAEVFYSSQN